MLAELERVRRQLTDTSAELDRFKRASPMPTPAAPAPEVEELRKKLEAALAESKRMQETNRKLEEQIKATPKSGACTLL
jgi:hypothetical protein